MKMLKTCIQVNPFCGNVPFDGAWGTGHSYLSLYQTTF